MHSNVASRHPTPFCLLFVSAARQTLQTTSPVMDFLNFCQAFCGRYRSRSLSSLEWSCLERHPPWWKPHVDTTWHREGHICETSFAGDELSWSIVLSAAMAIGHSVADVRHAAQSQVKLELPLWHKRSALNFQWRIKRGLSLNYNTITHTQCNARWQVYYCTPMPHNNKN